MKQFKKFKIDRLMRYLSLIFLFFFMSVTCVLAQNKNKIITGVVTDEQNNPLVGVSVLLKGSSSATITNGDGKFSLSVSPDKEHVIKFSYVGYDSREIAIDVKTVTVSVALKEQVNALNEVVAVGYGVQKKANLTGSVSSVGNKEIARRPVMRASAALQGLSAGVTVTQSSGQPGSDGATIRIRGIGTLNDSDPLILVDGVQGDLDGINPNDIESISVLKDAASSAIYGSRAANGVILVTTKSGTKDKLKANYDGYIGLQQFTKLPEFVDGYDYMLAMNEAYKNTGMSALYSDSYLESYLRYKNIDPDNYPDTDWQKALYTGSGITQNHYASVSGGTDRIQGFASFGYQDQEGILENFTADRYSIKSNITMSVNKWLKASMLLDGRRSTNTNPTYESIIKEYVNRIPSIYPNILKDGRYGVGYNGRNPVALALYGGNTVKTYDKLRASLQVDITPVKGLDIDLNFSPKLNNTYSKVSKKTVDTYYPGQETPAYSIPAISSLSQSDAKSTEALMHAIVRYNNTIKDHSFGLMAGYEQIVYKTSDLSLSREGYVLPEYEVIDAGSSENLTNGGSASEWALLSYFGRINYSYKSKYLLEANIRKDGSSRFADGHRYGIFPSFSAGWRISEEDFMKPLDWMSNLKFRASWGRLGNQEIGTYPAYSTITFGQSYVFNGKVANSGVQKSYANEDITWETSETSDIGVDVGFFKNKLTASFDYYVKNTSDILLRLPIAGTTGLNAPYQNAGVVRNNGWDLEVTYNNSINGFKYSMGFNLSDVHNKVIDLKGAGPIISGYNIIDEGYPINSIYGYKSNGLFRTSEDLSNYPSQSYFGTYGLGDIKYMNVSDENDQNVINAYDRTVIGNQIPRFTYGLNFTGSYKSFDMSLFFQGVGKRDIILTGDAVWALYNAGKMQKWQSDCWSESNVDASYPRLIAASSHNNFNYSDFWVYNAAYLRLKNMQIGYTVPKALTSRMGISNIRVYFTADNLFTIDDLPDGWDPEMNSGDAEIYPITKTYLAGIQFTF